ncbi:FtsX-like permease family protein [Fusibacter ferrireducens]|uniref:ABC transporter permease n=1 Tax=Fusibacter ferrireducens TaxID=2785058 RepID=A0ABR9ZWS5_9FIRM|nr:ABC transporter permease [Fusibacter ferrireducens]MBF4694069.1 ABC transporter permease [Fusibacter ferrireducens]
MKSYLGLVSEYAKVHKKKNRLTVICIAISVMLVTAIFGMADMSVKAQINAYIRQNGNFHAMITGLSDDISEKIGHRDDVKVSSFLGIAEDTTFQGKALYVQSSEKDMAKQMNLTVVTGAYPASSEEALLDQQGLEQFGLTLGDTIAVVYSDGQARQYKISGTYGDFSSLKGRDAHGLFLSVGGMRALPSDLYEEYYYVQFKSGVKINQALSEIKAEYHLTDEQVATNIRLLGLMGQSDDSSMQGIYLTGGTLFILVAMTGMFMIASSFNMSILERTQFFGLLRCLGATQSQVKRYIRLEGLQYCLKGIPIGLVAGCGVQWSAVFFLNTLSIQDIPPMPMLQISWVGVIAGTVIGFLVVMLASKSPANRAAKVSPQAAVTGNINQKNNLKIKKASNTNFFHVDMAMGFRHAFSNGKSMILIAGSFAISIILFLCFTVLITFMNHALNPLKPYAPDLSIKGVEETTLIDHALIEELEAIPDIQKVYGRMFYDDILANDSRISGAAMLISYDNSQFEWADKMMISGNIDDVKNGNGVAVSYKQAQNLGWHVGDPLTLNLLGEARQIQIACIISDVPFDSGNGSWHIVCSEKTFTGLTDISDYTIIDMQVGADVSTQIRNLLTSEMMLLDKQQRNNEVQLGYYTMAVFVYGFLIVIALVALINIINTVNASVSSRMSNYGVMRAVGMSGKQLKKVVGAEAATYAITGSIAGGVLGLYFHRLFFLRLITSNWGELWEPPLTVLTVTIAAAILTTFIAIILPAKKIESMSIVNVVNAQ